MGRTAIRTLASLVYSIDCPRLLEARQRAEQNSAHRLAAGVYVTHLAWMTWKGCADRLAQWIAEHPDAPVFREESGLSLATRKAVARLLADRWQDAHGIRPQVRRVDTPEVAP